MKKVYTRPKVILEIITLEQDIVQTSNTSITVGGNDSNNPLTPTTESWIDNEVQHDYFDL